MPVRSQIYREFQVIHLLFEYISFREEPLSESLGLTSFLFSHILRTLRVRAVCFVHRALSALIEDSFIQRDSSATLEEIREDH